MAKGGHNKIDLTGQRFGRLLVVGPLSPDAHGHSRWLVACDCGASAVRVAYALRRGTAVSCGCRKLELLNVRGGRSRKLGYVSWKSMLYRCSEQTGDPQTRSHYYDRGIRVCERWSGPDGFVNFVQDMGPRPSAKHSVDRIDNDGNYEPGNCRWATASEQQKNKRNNVMLTVGDETKCLREWARVTGVSVRTIRNRLSAGMSHGDAIAPIDRRRRNGPRRSCEVSDT